MFKYLENLRKKPEPERRRAVLWISLSITGAIALIWIVALGMRMNAGDFTFKNSPDSATPNIGNAFSNFFDQVSNSINASSSTSTE